MTIQQVLAQLALLGEFNADRQAEVEAVLAAEERSSPWYVQGLVGISAWIAALCFIGFLALAEIITSEIGALVTGVIFCGLAVGLRWVARRSTFGGQLALAVGLTGQALFIGGVGAETESVTAAAFAAIILELVLILIYPDGLQRFLAVVVIVGAVMALFYEWEILKATHILVLGLGAATLFIWEQEAYFSTMHWAAIYRPVGYACALSLLALLIPSVIIELEIELWWLSALGLLALLLVLEYLILAGLDVPWHNPLALGLAGGTLVLLWPAWQSPGLLGALLVLLVGFRRGNRLLEGLAGTFLAFFIIAFYYNLELTLLAKSFMLMGSGVIILALRYFLLRFWWRDASPEIGTIK